MKKVEVIRHNGVIGSWNGNGDLQAILICKQYIGWRWACLGAFQVMILCLNSVGSRLQHPYFFTLSPMGWINTNLSYAWLNTIFNKKTKAKARNKRDWRLFIFNRHGSHINIRFLKYYKKHWILIAVYPPHSTYKLQPLNICLFLPLTMHYS